MSARVTSGVLALVLARTLLLQSSWNYQTLQGGGVAYALLPLLRRVHRDEASLEAALERHASHFNAHPYLACLALGSLARLEADGADPDMIRRFRSALGGPLGALGDQLVWAAWLPLCSVIALILHFAGLSPGWVLTAFLVLYNGGHISMRILGFVEGWRSGAALGARLRGLGLSEFTHRLRGWLAGSLGILVGVALVAPTAQGRLAVAWGLAGLAALGVGAVLGPRAWRPTAAATVVGVGAVFLFGFLN